MTKERLEAIPLVELELIANNQGIDIPKDFTKQALIEIILMVNWIDKGNAHL